RLSLDRLAIAALLACPPASLPSGHSPTGPANLLVGGPQPVSPGALPRRGVHAAWSGPGTVSIPLCAPFQALSSQAQPYGYRVLKQSLAKSARHSYNSAI